MNIKEQLAAVKQDGWAIEYINSPSENVQLAAVKQDGWAIKYIDSSSENVQLAAAKQNGWAITFIKSPSEQIVKAMNCTLGNFFYAVNIVPKKKIQIGCTTLSLQKWLEYKSPYCEIVTNKLKELILEELK